MDHISTIIVHYNTPKETKECLDSLSKISTKNFDHNIIVVDNGSKKQCKITQKFSNASIELIRSESNLGFTGGNNLGISHAIKQYQSDYILLLNSDTEVDKDFLEHLYADIKNKPDVGISNPKIYFYKGTEFHSKSYRRSEKGNVLWYAGGSMDWENITAFHRGVDEVDLGQFDMQAKSEFATGCAMFIKREVIERVGILDKKFFLYSEDVDYSFRAKKYGYKIGFSPNSVVYHKNSASGDGVGSKIHDYYQTRNRLLLVEKHGSWRNKLTGVRLMFQIMKSGNTTKKQGVMHFVFRKFGKQQIT